MDALARAAQLRREADTVMSMIGLYEIVTPYSRVVPTGSYFLDVMVYPDIDLYLTPITHNQAQHICTRLAEAPLVREVKFEEDNPTLPGGLYINRVSIMAPGVGPGRSIFGLWTRRPSTKR